MWCEVYTQVCVRSTHRSTHRSVWGLHTGGVRTTRRWCEDYTQVVWGLTTGGVRSTHRRCEVYTQVVWGLHAGGVRPNHRWCEVNTQVVWGLHTATSAAWALLWHAWTRIRCTTLQSAVKGTIRCNQSAVSLKVTLSHVRAQRRRQNHSTLLLSVQQQKYSCECSLRAKQKTWPAGYCLHCFLISDLHGLHCATPLQNKHRTQITWRNFTHTTATAGKRQRKSALLSFTSPGVLTDGYV